MGRSKRRQRLRTSRAVLVLAAALATSGVACAGILGLDEFDKGECAGARCGDGAPPPDVVIPDGPVVPDGGDGGPDSTTGTDPTTWAKWVMPNYTLAPDATVGQGLSYADTASPDEVLDTVTSLTWKRAPSAPTATLLDARTICDGLDKVVKWRVPKRIELVTILDYGQTAPPFVRKGASGSPGFDGSKFPSSIVWTSSPVMEVGSPTTSVRPTKQYWAINFSTGKLVKVDGTSSNAVLCVKGL